MWAALQFALPAGAAFADARLERESGAVNAHVESSSRSTCTRAHSENCALCQVVGQASAPSESPLCPQVRREFPLPAVATRVERGSPALALVAPARAPPAL
jgi:hypothetical protein